MHPREGYSDTVVMEVGGAKLRALVSYGQDSLPGCNAYIIKRFAELRPHISEPDAAVRSALYRNQVIGYYFCGTDSSYFTHPQDDDSWPYMIMSSYVSVRQRNVGYRVTCFGFDKDTTSMFFVNVIDVTQA